MVGQLIRPIQDSKTSKVVADKLDRKLLQQEYRKDLLFEYATGEQPVGYQQSEPLLGQDLPAHLVCQGSQIGRIPALRLDLLLEEPRHTFCVLGRATPIEHGSNVGGNFPGTWLFWYG